MVTTRQFLAGLGLGAGVMYAFDPERGRRRRALARDRFEHLGRRGREVAEKTGRDVGNRLRGVGHELRSAFDREPVSAPILEQRVRAKLGRYVSHPSAIVVHCRDGRATLSGPVLDHEARPLLRGVRRVPGVREVEDRLERHERGTDVSGLQGEGRRAGPVGELRQELWSPAARVAAGAAGGGLLALGLARRDALGAVAGTAGLLVLVRTAANRPFRELAGVSDRRRLIDLQKTISVRAPIDEVYRIWSRPTNFPLFMSHVEKIEPLGGDRYRWTARGPGGTHASWVAQVVEQEENRRLSWETVDGSTVGSRGSVHFSSEPDGRTRVQVQMSYNPPAGALGHAVARVFGDDPKSAMDDDLLRFKSLLEAGKTTNRGREVRARELLH